MCVCVCACVFVLCSVCVYQRATQMFAENVVELSRLVHITRRVQISSSSPSFPSFHSPLFLSLPPRPNPIPSTFPMTLLPIYSPFPLALLSSYPLLPFLSYPLLFSLFTSPSIPALPSIAFSHREDQGRGEGDRGGE